jgi:hypothetical protein
MNYLLYDDKCLVCKCCAYVCRKIFSNTMFFSYTSFEKHWSSFPSAISKLRPGEVNLFEYSHSEWYYGDDAIEFMCLSNKQPISFWLNMYRLASKLRKKCNKCKLSEA